MSVSVVPASGPLESRKIRVAGAKGIKAVFSLIGSAGKVGPRTPSPSSRLMALPILLGQACRVRLERTCCSDHGDKRNENKVARSVEPLPDKPNSHFQEKWISAIAILECGRQQTQPSLPELEIGSRHRFLDSDRSQGLRPLATLRLPIA
jgi:hypothetical protein